MGQASPHRSPPAVLGGQTHSFSRIPEYAAGALCPLIVSPDVGNILLLRGHLSPERLHDGAIRPFDRIDWRDLLPTNTGRRTAEGVSAPASTCPRPTG